MVIRNVMLFLVKLAVLTVLPQLVPKLDDGITSPKMFLSFLLEIALPHPCLESHLLLP